MKRFIIIFMLLLPLSAMAQKNNLISHYQTVKGCTIVELSRPMLAGMGVDNNIERVEVIAIESCTLIPEFNERVVAETEHHTTIMSVISEGRTVSVYGHTDPKTGNTNQMLIFTSDDNKAIAVWLYGKDIELSDASSIVQLDI